MEERLFVLGPVSSLLAWRAAMAGMIDTPSEVHHHPDLQRCRANVRTLKKHPIVRALGNVPLDVIVGNARANHQLKSLDVIVLGGIMPDGSFNKLDEGLYLCSPELCLALLGRGGFSIHLVEVACELCGTYSLLPDASGRFINCCSRSSCQRVVSYLERLGRRHGRRACLEAMRFATDGSDSPRETSMFLCLTLPNRLRGYEIAKPRLNARLLLSERSRQSWGRDYILVDELYVDERGKPIAVGEYDSKEHHLHARNEDTEDHAVDVRKVFSDDLRREIIRDEGLDIVTVRTEDTKDFERFDAKAMRLGKLAGCEPIPSVGERGKRRALLFNALFDTGRWRREHHQLRGMAGYCREIVHTRARRAPGNDGSAVG